MDHRSALLMLRGVVADCSECGVERVLLPADPDDPGSEYCCTTCDAAVFLVQLVGPVPSTVVPAQGTATDRGVA